MNEAAWLTEEQASQATGVSSRTLDRFIEAGYLKIETGAEGSRQFLSSELERTFGVTIDVPKPPPAVPAATVEPEAPQAQDSAPSPEVNEQPESLSPAPAASNQGFIEEIARLKSSITLLERLLDRRDEDILDLKQQREWLKERVEKLEQKADRDQILLLSETQTIHRLIALQERRGSPLKGLLQWFGLAPETPPEGTMITHRVSNEDSVKAAGND